MKKQIHRLFICRWIYLFILIFPSACSTQESNNIAPSDTPTQIARMTIVGSTTLEPTRTPGAFPSLTPHIFCEGSPESFLIVGERGRVTQTSDDDETLNLRSGPGTNYQILEQIEPLESFFVLEGPQCSENYTWFQINYKGNVGWVAEGDEEQYYAEPYLTG